MFWRLRLSGTTLLTRILLVSNSRYSNDAAPGQILDQMNIRTDRERSSHLDVQSYN
jgi:hypothetical protein